MDPDRQRRLDELIGGHLDGALDANGVRELAALLESDAEARRAFARSVALDTVLPRLAAAQAAPAPASRLRLRARWWTVGAVAAAAAMLLVGLHLWSPQGGPRIEGQGAFVERGDDRLDAGRAIAVRSDDILRAGTGEAVVLWADEGTTMRLAPGSALMVGDSGLAKDVRLLRGHLAVEAGHQQQGRSLLVRAGQLQVAVVGTRFVVASEHGGGAVEVSEGAVAVTVDGRGLPQTVAAGQRAGVGADGRLQVGSASASGGTAGAQPGSTTAAAPRNGARLDPATWQADGGRGWIGTVRGNALAAAVEATAERVSNPVSFPGYARMQPDLGLKVDVTLARPGTLAVFIICRKPDGSDWLANYTVQVALPAGRHQRTWSITDLHVEKGAPLSAANGARVAQVAVCAWSQPVGLVVHEAVVGNGVR